MKVFFRFFKIFGVLLLLGSAFLLSSQKPLPVYLDETRPIEERVEDALSRMTLPEKIAMIHAQSKFTTPGCPRLGIPELHMSDGPHGVRQEIEWDSWKWAGWTNDSCTAFPALTCLAATFNPELAYEYGNALGEEARFRNKDVILGPGVNIYRTPLNGRNFEYLGEDPWLASRMVVPYVQGVQRNGVAVSVKHYALNNQEVWRGHINVVVSERALREIYLPAFRAAVQEGSAWTMMGAYNKYLGEWCCHNDVLLNKILKEEWGFDGAVVTDWGGAHDTDQAVRNGLDIEMGTGSDGLTVNRPNAYDGYYLAWPFYEGIINGKYDVALLNEKVRRVLRLTFRTSMARNRPFGSLASPGHAAVARRVAEEGIVLLKNDRDFFPIPVERYKTIAVIGENATRVLTAGGGSSELKPKNEISPLAGLIEKYGADRIVYTMGYASGPPSYGRVNPSPFDADSLVREAVRLARGADAVLFIGGLNKNHEQDCEAGDRKGLGLPFGQDRLIEEIFSVNKNLGIILISGNAVAMPWLDRVPGVIQSWYLGSEAGPATAAVVSGDVNPSGRLPFTFPKRLEDVGAHFYGRESYPGDSINQYYKEDIFVGYRWYDARQIAPEFPFGYGLSYTTFEYGKVSVDKPVYAPGETVQITLALKNTGRRAGAETVQVYATQKNPALPRPPKELKAFQKVFLQPGQTQQVTISVNTSDLACYDDRAGRWVLAADEYTLSVAASSADVRGAARITVR